MAPPPKTPHLYVEEDRGYETPCWVWTRAVSGCGYGYLRVGRTLRRAHVVFYERAYGPLPDGYVPDHLCRVPLCVRPDHLEAVTRAENIRRGRSAKLGYEAAAEIRYARARGEATISDLARRYSVHRRTIQRAASGQAWA